VFLLVLPAYPDLTHEAKVKDLTLKAKDLTLKAKDLTSDQVEGRFRLGE